MYIYIDRLALCCSLGCSLVSAMHAHLQPWVPRLLELVRMHWHGPLLLQVIIGGCS